MEKTDFITWLKAHKKQLVIAGISVAAMATIVLGIKNKEAITELWAYLESSLKKAKIPEHQSTEVLEVLEALPIAETTIRTYTPCSTCFDVNSHIRLLPEGKHHSAAKAAEAAAAGIELRPNQTLVDGYVKGVAA